MPGAGAVDAWACAVPTFTFSSVAREVGEDLFLVVDVVIAGDVDDYTVDLAARE
jgi:hypothetical protein